MELPNISSSKYLLNKSVAQVNIGWFNKDSVNGTTEVLGSVSQYQAPIDVLIDIIVSTTVSISLHQFNDCLRKKQTYCATGELTDLGRLLLQLIVARMLLNLKYFWFDSVA